ncbi:hypothetical protein JVU11DRAFT_10725 [Chiua virens]|nr:hypothetical protein JVU11DRAFT_10725 [Chiua virens]
MATETRPPSILSSFDHAHSLKSNPSQTSLPRCTECNPRKKQHTRNLVVCIDGTANQFGRNDTNVVKVFDKINLESTDPEQYAYYSSGIGTRPAKSFNALSRVKDAVSDTWDMAVAWNVDKNIKEAYSWLAGKYQEGDQLYFFGFSRGPYQVRVLANMIHEVGLVTMPTEKQIGTVYTYYEAIQPGKPKTRDIAARFKKTFSWRHARVHFIGVWDTVSSVGFVRGGASLSMAPHAANACHIRHALALDELRVKFLPEYFHEANSQTDGGNPSCAVSSDIGDGVVFCTPTTSSSNAASSSSAGRKHGTADVQEVWFAGSHSDVGGLDKPGKYHQAGNVSLLWMRREATVNGLLLQPTHRAWVPDDLDFGVKDSMSSAWRAVEYMPIKHQATFSGAGGDARRLHLLHPRRIIPGQKVHASVLFATAYMPKATPGEGFDIPIVQAPPDVTELDSKFWETGLFDDGAAQKLMDHLSGEQGVPLIYLTRLLFMLRFEEGKKYVKNISNWEGHFKKLIYDDNCASHVRLVTVIAYHEASCSSQVHTQCAQLGLSQDVFDDAKNALADILAKSRHRDGARAISLLRPLTKHPILRQRLLTNSESGPGSILENLVKLLDGMIGQSDGSFGQAMDTLTCLLQCDDTQKFIIQKLGDNYPHSEKSRVSRILNVHTPRLLTAALRMMLILARLPRAKDVCSAAPIKHHLRELARKDEGLVGLLAVEVLLALYDPSEKEHLDCHDIHVRANLASAMVHLNHGGFDSADGPSRRGGDAGQKILHRLFGLGVHKLTDAHEKLIKELKNAVQKGNVRERTIATMTLLKLCETEAIRRYLLEIGLTDVLINQLQRKDSALLAAHALVTCLKYDDMKHIKNDELLPKRIISMLRLDYFDDTLGSVEGFQIFGGFMQHADLRGKIEGYNITEVVKMKLRSKPTEIRTSLICLGIFRSFDPDKPWTEELIDTGMEKLKKPAWKTQKEGVAILCALAHTEHGVNGIRPRIKQIIEMLLPESYLETHPSLPRANTMNPALASEARTRPATLTLESHSWSLKPTQEMMGPACALRILVQNKNLRECTRKSLEYAMLKDLFLSGTLLDEKTDTPPWRIATPDRRDVIDMLDKLFKTVDECLLAEGGQMSLGNLLPNIQHWDHLISLLRHTAVSMAVIPSALLGGSALAALVVVGLPPIYLSTRVYGFFRQLFLRYQETRILDELRGEDSKGHSEADTLGEHVDEGVALEDTLEKKV